MKNYLKLILFSIVYIYLNQIINAQSYELSLRQRRMADKIGVEFWIKAENIGDPGLGELTVGIEYNTSFLSPNSKHYVHHLTDSIDYNIGKTAPSPYRVIRSEYLDGQDYGGTNYKFEKDENKSILFFFIKRFPPPHNVIIPINIHGRGSFLGRVEFNIINLENLTNSNLTDINFTNYEINGLKIKLIDTDGKDVTTSVNFVDPEPMTIKGITILHPNGPKEIVNRNRDYPALSTSAYPIYFERSGIFTPSNYHNYGATTKLAYIFDYILGFDENKEINSQNWIEFLRIAEHDEKYSELHNPNLYSSGEIITNNGFSSGYLSGYLITQGNGYDLPGSIDSQYEGVLRVMWENDPEFPFTSDKARIRIRQLETINIDKDIVSRNIIKDSTYDISDTNFTLIRLPLSVKLQDNNQIIFYPNPTSDIINIDKEISTNIELFDIFGNKLLEDFNTKLDISHLSPGTYYIRYFGQTKMVVKI